MGFGYRHRCNESKQRSAANCLILRRLKFHKACAAKNKKNGSDNHPINLTTELATAGHINRQRRLWIDLELYNRHSKITGCLRCPIVAGVPIHRFKDVARQPPANVGSRIALNRSQRRENRRKYAFFIAPCRLGHIVLGRIVGALESGSRRQSRRFRSLQVCRRTQQGR